MRAMMRGWWVSMVPVLVLTVAAEAVDFGDAARAGRYAPWLGLYPHDKIGGLSFLETFKLEGRLKALLGEEKYRTTLDALGTVTPYEERNGIVHFGECRSHACPLEYIEIYINVATDTVSACHLEENTRWPVWYSEGAPPKTLEGLDCGMDENIYEKATNTEKYLELDQEHKQNIVGKWEGSIRVEEKGRDPEVATMTMHVTPHGKKKDTLKFTQSLTLELLQKQRKFSCTGNNRITIQSEGEVQLFMGEVTFNRLKVSDGNCGGKPGKDTLEKLEGGQMQYPLRLIGITKSLTLKKQR